MKFILICHISDLVRKIKNIRDLKNVFILNVRNQKFITEQQKNINILREKSKKSRLDDGTEAQQCP